MAEQQKTQNKSEETNPGTPRTEATDTADVAVAKKNGISEGAVKALRDDAGVNALAGHAADIHAWSLSDEGKEYAKGEKDREKAYKAETEAYDKQFDKQGLSPADKAYAEAVKG